MLYVGIIGLGPQWEQRYRPALHRLRDRIQIRAIYDPIIGRTDLAAEEFGAVACRGMLELLTFSRVNAVLILDDGWQRDAALSFVLERDKPVFVADFSAFSPGKRYGENSNVRSTSSTLIPGLSLRYSPVTCRLRELMATRLGAALEIQIDVRGHTDSTLWPIRLIELCDWCQYLTGTPPQEVLAQGDFHVQIKYRQAKRGTVPAVARMTFSTANENESFMQGNLPDRFTGTAQVLCEHGTATLSGTNEIIWTHAGFTQTEHLEGEREATDVLLDLFCRRVHGGLVPVPTPEDVAVAARTTTAMDSSRKMGTAHSF